MSAASDADLVIYGTLLTVAVIVALMSWWAIREERRRETTDRHVTVDTVRRAADARLQGGPLAWGIWQQLLSIRELRLRLHDDRGDPVTEITFFHVPLDGVRQAFALDGRRYACVNEGLLRGRSWLRDEASGEIVLSCRHRNWRTDFYRGTGDDLLFSIRHGTLFTPHSTLLRGDEEIGRLFSVYEPHCHARVLSLRAPGLSRLEQCFVFVSLPGRR